MLQQQVSWVCVVMSLNSKHHPHNIMYLLWGCLWPSSLCYSNGNISLPPLRPSPKELNNFQCTIKQWAEKKIYRMKVYKGKPVEFSSVSPCPFHLQNRPQDGHITIIEEKTCKESKPNAGQRRSRVVRSMRKGASKTRNVYAHISVSLFTTISSVSPRPFHLKNRPQDASTSSLVVHNVPVHLLVYSISFTYLILQAV